ncbi:proteasome component pre4 [Pyrenophora seminiperda CCB06]|uniref:Proteasome component pre4 n=1 Tax=Pyrenophora seminiperda CCB06 TaxID=1302712 RepID=A0A3M7MHD3_9PLEO|nr:proteasome component pre4 [Pyrenophora seminiperda CCB06]
MLGIDYPDSDEEDVVAATNPDVRLVNVPKGPIATNIELTNVPTVVAPAPAPQPLLEPTSLEQPSTSPGPVNGPAQGPTVSPPPAEDGSSNDAAPGSPYTMTRALIQNLTLPTVPNFNIPPSPPGSPPQKATKKFAQFLELKKKGQHFNQRLEGSAVLRDPGHLPRLLDFAGVSEEDAYASTLSEGVAIPPVFPEWAYVEELKASQKRLAKAKEQGKSKAPRQVVEFVSASASTGKRKELEHRGRDETSSKSSRSPKRRRSKSRERK